MWCAGAHNPLGKLLVLGLICHLLVTCTAPGLTPTKSDPDCVEASTVKEPCHNKIRLVTTTYQVKNSKGTCVTKKSMNTMNCDHTGCAPPRVLEPGICKSDGSVSVLVEHEERNSNGRCVTKHSYVVHKCDKNKKGSDCPEPTHKQKECENGFRRVFKFYHVKNSGGKCVKKVELKEEACAALQKSKSCPIQATTEKSPCDSSGMRTVKRIFYERDRAGVCKQKSKTDSESCSDESKRASSCGGEKHKEKPCRDDGTRLIIREYFVQENGECKKKFESRESPCHEYAKQASQCPISRVLEPSPCNEKGYVDQLVNHYERNPKTGKCELKIDHIPHVCPGGSDKKISSNNCPEPQFHQHVCEKGFRSIFKFYWTPRKEGGCRKKMELKREQCAKLVPSNCPKDQVLETGICDDKGFRSNIKFSYIRDKKNKCVKTTKTEREFCPKKAKKESVCPPEKVTVGICNKNFVRIDTTKYYVKSEGECKLRVKKSEKPCTKKKGSKLVCPPPRIVEPGPCTSDKVKTLVEHYEPDYEKGKCVLKRTYETQKCPTSAPPPAPGKRKPPKCPDPKFHQGPCEDGFRTLTKTYFIPSEVENKCRRKFEMKREACAKLVSTSCPNKETLETGLCEKGFRTDIVFNYERDKKGKCHKIQKTVTMKCGEKEVGCPKAVVNKIGGCVKGVQRNLKIYYVYGHKKDCRKKFEQFEKACGGKTKVNCPLPRVVEPGACEPGQSTVSTLIEHYEYNEKKKKCEMKRSFKRHACPSKPPKGTPCPDPTFHQAPCAKGFRKLTKFYYVWSDAEHKCRKKIELKEEQCASLVATNCPPVKTLETGLCDKNNMRTDIVFKYHRDEKGVCKQTQVVVPKKCTPKDKGCPASSTSKKGDCKTVGVQTYIRQYYVYDNHEMKCVKKFKLTEHPCKKAGVKCPLPRVVEPGPCDENGRSTSFIEHWEFDKKKNKCVKQHSVKVEHMCKKPINVPGQKNQICPDPQYHQNVCSGSFRTVTKIYWINNSEGKCKKKFKLNRESCAKLVKHKGCPKAETVEDGICNKQGYRTDIVYHYQWSKDGKKCEKKQIIKTIKCTKKEAACPKSSTVSKQCTNFEKERITTYYKKNHEGRCVKKFRAKMVSCAPKGQCPPPRIIEPGACENGVSSVLVAHFEKPTKAQIADAGGKLHCKEVHTLLKHPCGKHAAPTNEGSIKGAKDVHVKCPDPTFNQQPCKGSFRIVTKFWYYKSSTGKCKKKIELKMEQCAALVATGCPKAQVIEGGICKDGFVSEIKYKYLRDKKGKCKRTAVTEVRKCLLKPHV